MNMRMSMLRNTARPSVGARPVARVSTSMRASATEKEEVAASFSPSTAEVEGILSTLVHETDIMEMTLEIGDFSLSVKRNTSSPPPPAPVEVAPPPPELVPRAETPVKASAPQPELIESVDESVLNIVSPKVGIFRRGRYAGNKRVGKNNCVNEGDQIKKGDPIGFVEQLGTFVPVKAPEGGEILKFEVKDGQAVEYLEPVVVIAPFFGRDLVV